MTYTNFPIYVQRRPDGGECDPYSRQAPTSMDIDLIKNLVRVDATAVDVNLCEGMT